MGDRHGHGVVARCDAPSVRLHRRAGKLWALILAGGDGVRLRPLTRQIAGDDRPKQFCALLGGDTLLEQTRPRAHLLVEPSRVVSVEGRANHDLALDPDPPAVQLDKLPTQGQPQPRALLLRRADTHLAKLLEHGVLVLGRMPTPVSLTETSTDPSTGTARTSILPPSAVN